MSSELHIEVNGFRISVVRVGPEPPPASANPAPPRSLESSTSSFEFVGDRPEPVPRYPSSSPASSPYPLQASGPSSWTSLPGPPVDLPSSSRPVVRSLFSSDTEQYPLQAPRAPCASAGHSSESPEEASSRLLPASPLSVAALPRTTLSSPYRVPEYPLQGPLRSLEELEGAFPALPKELCNTCRALRGGSLSWEARALRAWKAGCWARSILEGWSEVTKPSEPVGISNRVYCVIAARGLSCPVVVHSFAGYKKVVGELRRGESISHAFPSEAEARLYFAGAGVDYPSA